MARSKKVNFTRSLLKIGKATNRLRRAVNSASETLDPSSSGCNSLYAGSPAGVRTKLAGTATTPQDVAYEAKIVGKLGGSVARHFYIKLVGVKSRNSDKSSRKEAIQQLEECQELELRRERDNRFDPNAVLVGAPGKTAAGYLPARLAGDVSRSLDQGYVWRCYVRRILHAPGTDNWGITVCMVKHNKGDEVSSPPGMTGGEFLAKYYPEYNQRMPRTRPTTLTPSESWAIVAVLCLLALALLTIVHGC
jgi:HIRAN domain